MGPVEYRARADFPRLLAQSNDRLPLRAHSPVGLMVSVGWTGPCGTRCPSHWSAAQSQARESELLRRVTPPTRHGGAGALGEQGTAAARGTSPRPVQLAVAGVRSLQSPGPGAGGTALPGIFLNFKSEPPLSRKGPKVSGSRVAVING